jgi:hypothetical protein
MVDRANLDMAARDLDGARAEHDRAVKLLAEKRGSLVRVVERATQLSASLSPSASR